MAFHGKKTRIIVGGYDLMNIGYSARQTFSKDIAPSDTFGLEHQVFEAGQRGGVFTLDSRHKGDSDEMQAMIDDLVLHVDENPELIYGPAGMEVGAQVFVSETHHNSCEVSSDTKSVVSLSCSFTADGGVFPGILLISPYT